MNQHTAQGTSLVVVIFAAGTGLITYAFTGYVAWDFVGLLLCGSLIGAYLGARVVQRFPEDALRLIFGLFLLLLALRFLIWTSLPPLIESSGTIEIVAGIVIGFVGGFAAGVLGIGGGAIFEKCALWTPSLNNVSPKCSKIQGLSFQTQCRTCLYDRGLRF